jgi:hypothetical protein
MAEVSPPRTQSESEGINILAAQRGGGRSRRWRNSLRYDRRFLSSIACSAMPPRRGLVQLDLDGGFLGHSRPRRPVERAQAIRQLGRQLQHFPVNLNRKDSQSVKDERVCRR